VPPQRVPFPQREFFIDNLLVRIHFIIVMIRWTGLAPREFEWHTWNVPPHRVPFPQNTMFPAIVRL